MYTDNVKKYYPHMVEVYSKYMAEVKALMDKIDDEIYSVMDEQDRRDINVSGPITVHDRLQVYVKHPSKDAKFVFTDSDGDAYYRMNMNGLDITEVVQRNIEP